ncbi:MAG: hypothetical protein HY735_36310 [Verrucomicrobia bacterium]|nr:hypothetical protein [Verrucomicrobiota bacterium]
MRIAGVIAAAGMLSLAPVHGFVTYLNSSGKVLRWNLVSPGSAVHSNVVNRQTRAIRYFISADAFSAANKPAELNAVRACFAQWQSVPGTILKFEQGGLTGPGADINVSDNTNVVFWAKSSTMVNGGMDDISGLAGYTVTAFSIDATPGLRSFIVQQGTNVAYANGYLEVLPPFPDFNFDGLDDTFQRRYFPLFTAPEAAPGVDPDGDGYDNRSEFRMGSDPANPLSFVFRIQSVTLKTGSSTISWESVAGKKYQVVSRTEIPGGSWQPLGNPVVARGSNTQFLDSSATNRVRFYRVQALP